MAAVNKIDSNVTGLRYAEEISYKVLPGSPVWNVLEPNSYADFGGQLTLVARNPINENRQRKKGVITDLDASGGLNSDITQSNLQDILQGYFFADLRRKGEEIVTSVDESGSGTEDSYAVADTTGFLVGDLIEGQNFTNSANNAVNVVTAVVPATSVDVADAVLVDEATPPATAQIVVVGRQGTADDIDVVVTGDYATYRSTTLDWTTLGLIPGEWIFVGGDTATERFTNTENNGFKRIRSISATDLVVDKSTVAMTAEVSAGSKTVNFYFGRVLKNELGTAITRRTYNLERTLGAPDDALPSEIQAEYLVGALPSQVTFNIETAAKITADLAFVAADNETIDGPTALKSGDRPALAEEDAFNTSSDFSRIKMAIHSTTSETPSALFAFLTDLTVVINNNPTPNKAVATLGSFDVTAGTFQVSGNVTAYFADVAAVAAVRNNSDVTIDFAIAKANAGWAMDLPLIALGEGRLTVEQDQPVQLPLSMDAATAAKIDPNLDYTAMMVFFDYLPTLAETL